jgi:hypothetical protein
MEVTNRHSNETLRNGSTANPETSSSRDPVRANTHSIAKCHPRRNADARRRKLCSNDCGRYGRGKPPVAHVFR